MKMHYWIICYVVAACVFLSRPNPLFFCLIPVFIRLCLHVLLEMVYFLLRFYYGFVPLSAVLSVHLGGGRARPGGVVDLNGHFLQVLRDAIRRDIFTATITTMGPTPSLVPGSSSDLGIEFYGAPGSTILRPKLRSGH